MKEVLKKLFTRDLLKLKSEITSYKSESILWHVEGAVNNSGGNLCLHIIGNLNTFIGHGIGKSGYVRDRVFEFGAKGVDKNKMLKDIDETIESVTSALELLTEDMLQRDFPVTIWEEPKGMIFTLLHLHGHLTYHLGQISYHRRLLDK